MKKLLITFIVLTLLVATLSFSASAEEYPAVVDAAEILTSSEEAELLEMIEYVADKSDFDITIVTTNNLEGYSIADYNDLYPYIDTSRDGIVFVQYPMGREFSFSSRGAGMNMISYEGEIYIENQFLPHLSQDDYFEAHKAFINAVDEMLDHYYDEGEAFDEMTEYVDPAAGPAGTVIGIIGGIIVAFVVTGIMKSSMNTAKKQRAAADYMRHNSLRLTRNEDRFSHEHTTKTKIEKSSGSGGGSSSSRRSSSRSGRSGRY